MNVPEGRGVGRRKRGVRPFYGQKEVFSFLLDFRDDDGAWACMYVYVYALYATRLSYLRHPLLLLILIYSFINSPTIFIKTSETRF